MEEDNITKLYVHSRQRLAEHKILGTIKYIIDEWEDDMIKSNDFVALSFEELVDKLRDKMFGRKQDDTDV
jgi:hypothetical protein